MGSSARVIDGIFGVRLHDLSSETDLRRVCEGFLDGERTFRIFTPNPEILLRAREDPTYADVLDAADLALPDGTGVALAASLRARRRVRRWPGVEVAATLLRLAAERGETVAFFGGADGIADRAAARWRARLPGLLVEAVGSGSPVGDDGVGEPARLDQQLVDEIRGVGPRIVLVGLGSPKQERWISRHRDDLPSARILIGIGGAFDMWAGRLRRSPAFVRRVGLEWAWRLALEPHRLPRVLRATIVFPLRALIDRSR